MAPKKKDRVKPVLQPPLVPSRLTGEEVAVADEKYGPRYQFGGAPDINPGGVGPRGMPGTPMIPPVRQPGPASNSYVSSADFVPDEYGLVSTEERRRFGSSGIEKQNEFESAQNVTTRIPIEQPERDPLNPYAPTPGGFSVVGANPDAPDPYVPPKQDLGQAGISRADAVNALPVNLRSDWSSRQDFVISNYPTLYQASQEANLTQSETRDLVNLTLAVDAALTVGRTVDPRRQTELLKAMPKPQAALVIDILNAMTEERQQQRPREDAAVVRAGLDGSVDVAKRVTDALANDAEQNPILAAVKDWFWNPSVNLSGLAWIYPDTDWGPIQDGELYFGGKGVFDTLVSANEMTVRGANTLQLSGFGTNQSLESAWNATEAGSFDPTMIRLIRENNDPVLVDVMLEFKRLAATGNEDPVSALLDKYGTNPDALAALDRVISNTDPNSDISKLGNEIDAAETSNVGNVFAWSFASMFGADAGTYAGIESFADNPAARGGAKVANVTSTVGLDPTLGASRVAAGYRIARYGLARMEPGKVGQVFEKAAVRNHYDYLGKQFESIRDLEDVGQKAQRLETLASQNRKWYSYDAVRTMFDAGVKDAASARAFFESGANMEVLLSGQAMKRGSEWTVPHMTKANAVWKATTFKLRGLNPANAGGSKKFIDNVFGPDTSRMMPEDAADHIARVIEEDPAAAGRMLSDFVYTDTGGVDRTLLGRIIGTDADEYAMRNRYGWRRKGLLTGDFTWFADRLGRLMARMPDTSRGILVSDASDAGKVKEVAQSLGMSRYFANYLKFIWPSMDEPARVRLVNGLNSSAITASGVDLVSPELARDLSSAFAVASRPSTQYAADQVDVLAIRTLAEKRVEMLNQERKAQNAELLTDSERAAAVSDEVERLTEEAVRKAPGMSGAERGKALVDEFDREFRKAVDEGRISNPSRLNDTDNYALYDTQLTKRVSIFDAQKMNQIMARQSYLNMLLGGGPKITTVTDLWTLATLAGPRFVMRSGLEDFGLYALTGGKFFGHGGWLDNRRASAAIREAIMRGPSEQIVRGNNPGMKLSLAATARREVGTRLARRLPVMRGLILPYLDADEVAKATALAAQRGPEKSRKAIADLVATGMARARFFSANRLRYARGEDMKVTGEAKEAADVISEGVRRGYLNSNMDRASEVTEHLADGSATALHRGPQPELTELVEGVSITYKPVGVEPVVSRTGLDVRNVTSGYRTTFETGRRNHDDLERLYMELDQSLYQSGYKSYLAIAQSQQYYRLRMAVLKAKNEEKAADAEIALEEFISDFAAQIADDPNLSRYVLVDELGVDEYAKRLLDDALRMMTTRTGKYNLRMYDRLRLPNHRVVRISQDLAERAGLPHRPNKSGIVRVVINQDEFDNALRLADDVDAEILKAAGRPIRTYKDSGVETERKLGLYYYDDEGKFHYNLDVNGLHDPELPMPHSIGVADQITVPVTDKMPFTSGAWSRMGRALARMTREPIYLSNYYDSYKAVAAFKSGMIDDLVRGGKSADEAAEMAEDWAHKFAADKAYEMTMAGVDNPAVRSQLAWQVRNIARFYRALEDFNRRMVRVAENKPETFWKLALAWNVLDDSGYVWEDEYGDKYLMFPGTQAAFQGVNQVLSAMGVQSKVPALPFTWGARVTMFTPSTDPNAAIPTLGSPMSALGLKSTLRLLPSLGWISKETSQAAEGALFGEYSPQQTLTAALASDTFGPNLKRVMDSWNATYGGFESRQSMTDTAVAVAGKQAIHAMAAAGLFDPSKDYTPEEIVELKAVADTTAVNSIYMKMILTPLLPATPQAMTTDVSDEARAIGIDSHSALWIKYLNKYPSYEEAFVAFTRDNPGKAMFTVSKYESTDFYEQTLEAQKFIEKNREEFDARPTGLSHFAPSEGTYGGLTSFYFARANGIKIPTTVEDFFNKTIRAAGQAEMRWAQMEAAALVDAGNDPGKVQQALSKEKDEIRARFPYAEYEMTFDADRKAASVRDADEIATTARYMVDSNQDADGRAAKYLDVYTQYKKVVRWQAETEKGSKDRSRANSAWRSYVANEAMALMPSDDDRWVRWLKILSAGLNIQVEALNGR